MYICMISVIAKPSHYVCVIWLGMLTLSGTQVKFSLLLLYFHEENMKP